MRLKVKDYLKEPVIKKGDPGTEGIKYGFEGGRVVVVNGTYHLFTSEMLGEPRFVKMRLAHWSSKNGRLWERISTLYESSGEYEGKDPRASLWSPMPIYDDRKGKWNLFYVSYKSKPSTDTAWYENYGGRIWRAEAVIAGLDGIEGPFKDVDVVMEPGAASDSWEGLQGTDSFFPYRVGDKWFAFYGSAGTQKLPVDFWGVGLATSDRLDGIWKRCSRLNPVPIDDVWVENPVVVPLKEGLLIALFDGGPRGTFGYSVSEDGIRWSRGEYLHFNIRREGWIRDIRTPLSLLDNGDGTFMTFYSAFDHNNYGCISMATLEME